MNTDVGRKFEPPVAVGFRNRCIIHCAGPAPQQEGVRMILRLCPATMQNPATVVTAPRPVASFGIVLASSAVFMLAPMIALSGHCLADDIIFLSVLKQRTLQSHLHGHPPSRPCQGTHPRRRTAKASYYRRFVWTSADERMRQTQSVDLGELSRRHGSERTSTPFPPGLKPSRSAIPHSETLKRQMLISHLPEWFVF